MKLILSIEINEGHTSDELYELLGASDCVSDYEFLEEVEEE